VAITTLAGVLDVGVYALGYFPQGTDVGADFTQIINKLNESIGVVNANTADIVTSGDALSVQSALIQANYDDLAAYEVSNDASVAALAVRATDLESATLPGPLTVNGSTNLTAAQVTGNNAIIVQNAGGGGTPKIMLPTNPAMPASFYPLLIVNIDYTDVHVHLNTTTWANGAASDSAGNLIKLSIGESVTVYPCETSGGTMEWAIVGGHTYADLEAE